MKKGTLVRLKAPGRKIKLENEWYYRHWEAGTPMVYLGLNPESWGWSQVMTADEGVCTVWAADLTTQMRRGYHGA